MKEWRDVAMSRQWEVGGWWKEEETSGWVMSMRGGGEGRGRRGREARQGGMVLRLQVNAIASSGVVRV